MGAGAKSMDDRPALDSTVTRAKAQPSAWESAFRDIRRDFVRLTGDFPAIGDCVPFSPQAYNAISAIVMRSVYDYVEGVAGLSGDIPYHSNAGVLLFRELHTTACSHYFREYERFSGFHDPRAEAPAATPSGPSPRRYGLGGPVLRRGAAMLVDTALRWSARRGARRVRWAGVTTFSWRRLLRQLRPRGIRLEPVDLDLDRGPAVPRIERQAELLGAHRRQLHRELSEAMGASPDAVRELDREAERRELERVCRMVARLDASDDLVVTGTLGGPARIAALQAQARGIPVLTVHHGGHAPTFDEPFNPLYEDALPDARVLYGSIDRLGALGLLGVGPNLAGNRVLYFARTDPGVRRLYAGRPVRSAGSLSGLRPMYVASEFESNRYGPYRDVHPVTYLGWQERLLAWLEERTGRPPLLRLHPKRPSTRYDPQGHRDVTGAITDVLDAADILVIDYPTTALAYAAATDKPVLFFDLGLRRLYPAAFEAVRGRCHYAATDILNPDEAFSTMESDLSRECTDTFTPTFSLAPENRDEAAGVADAVCALLEQGAR